MSKKISVNENLSSDGNLSEVTGTHDSVTNKTGLDVSILSGMSISPNAKYVEAIYSNSDMTVTYNYYESSSKVTSYGSIIVNYTEGQDTTFTSAEWV